MPIAQFLITWDDLVNNANESQYGMTVNAITGASTSYNNVATLIRPLGLVAGKYRVRVDGFEAFSGYYNNTSYNQNPQTIQINSSRFAFRAGGTPGLVFANNGWGQINTIKGHREFEMNYPGGNIDLSISVNQYGTNINAGVNAVAPPYIIDKSATWTSAAFAYCILTLNFEDANSSATYGLVGGAFK